MPHSKRSRTSVDRRIRRGLAGAALPSRQCAGAAQAATVLVTSAADAGPDTFRAAVDAANANPAVDTIEFDGPLAVTLDLGRRLHRRQHLTILGADSTLSGDGSMDATWDGGLFVSRGAADITIEDLSFQDSFNNGVGIFIPAGGGPVAVTLTRVTIQGSRFHGLYVDDQLTATYLHRRRAAPRLRRSLAFPVLGQHRAGGRGLFDPRQRRGDPRRRRPPTSTTRWPPAARSTSTASASTRAATAAFARPSPAPPPSATAPTASSSTSVTTATSMPGWSTRGRRQRRHRHRRHRRRLRHRRVRQRRHRRPLRARDGERQLRRGARRQRGGQRQRLG